MERLAKQNVWWFQSVYVLPAWRKGSLQVNVPHISKKKRKKRMLPDCDFMLKPIIAAQKTYEAMGMQCEHYKMYEWLKKIMHWFLYN
jgi:hypothetical protein